MWSDTVHKAVFEDSEYVINALRNYINLRPVSEVRPIKGSIYLEYNFWKKRSIEEFFGLLRRKPAVKVVDVEVLSDTQYRIVYHLNPKYDKKEHRIEPRYLLGRLNDRECLFKLIAFDLVLNNINQEEEYIEYENDPNIGYD